ncbi:DUF2569 domain-containing protein [Arvimicrobium flavum]|uniref:DUF2569 domain-containing protein n=1 Tax=Arvimicrobium flavum TaxID=3393320 RepID=UPI00237A61E9|nr:DUF2569 domain-containing protein [Mesorhizobium shangrilense]
MIDARAYDLPAREGPEGIGGWLVLPIIGLILTPIQGVVQIGQYMGLMQSFEFLTGPQATLLVLEIIANVAIAIVLPAYLLRLLFSRKREFPRTYVVWAGINLAFLIADLMAAKILFGQAMAAARMTPIESETTQTFLRAIAMMAIWVPYMLNSRRVRNTFVH